MARVIVCRPGEDARVEEIEDPFKHTHDVLIKKDSLVQILALEDGVSLYCDEEGQLNGAKFNRSVPDRAKDIPEGYTVIYTSPNLASPGDLGWHHLYGNFLLTRVKAGKEDEDGVAELLYEDLSDVDVKKYLDILNSTAGGAEGAKR